MTLTPEDLSAIRAIFNETATATATKPAINPDAVYTAKEAAALVGMTRECMSRKLCDGIIVGKRRMGGQWRLTGRELLKLA